MTTTKYHSKVRFPLGHIVATPGALRALAVADIPPSGLADLISRHVAGDYGTLDPEDVLANEDALIHGDRILSAYILPDGTTKVWIITEADRSVTTLLLPEEY